VWRGWWGWGWTCGVLSAVDPVPSGEAAALLLGLGQEAGGEPRDVATAAGRFHWGYADSLGCQSTQSWLSRCRYFGDAPAGVGLGVDPTEGRVFAGEAISVVAQRCLWK
jgi:hypothetical protein